MRKVIGIVLGLFIVVAIGFVVARNVQADDTLAVGIVEPQPHPERDALSADAAPKPAGDATQAEVAPAEHHLIAYYFMNDVRCPSCVKIETWTHGAIEEAFADELKEGKIVWRMVNTDTKENNHFIKDYEIVTKQVILVEMNKGKEVKWTNLGEVWNLLGDEEKFKTYIVAETTKQLAWDEKSAK